MTMNSRRNAFGICLVGGLLAGATPTLWDVGIAPGSVLAAMSGTTRMFWAAMLVGGAALALVGIALRDAALGVILEAVGMALLAIPSGLYAVVAIDANGWSNAALAAGAFAGLAVGGIARAAQCFILIYRAYALGRALDRLQRKDREIQWALSGSRPSSGSAGVRQPPRWLQAYSLEERCKPRQ